MIETILFCLAWIIILIFGYICKIRTEVIVVLLVILTFGFVLIVGIPSLVEKSINQEEMFCISNGMNFSNLYPEQCSDGINAYRITKCINNPFGWCFLK